MLIEPGSILFFAGIGVAKWANERYQRYKERKEWELNTLKDNAQKYLQLKEQLSEAENPQEPLVPENSQAGVVKFAQYVRNYPQVAHNKSRLLSMLHEIFPSDDIRVTILEETLRKVGKEIKNTSDFSEDSLQQLCQLAMQKCRRSESDTRQAVLFWAFVFGKCSLDQAKQWQRWNA